MTVTVSELLDDVVVQIVVCPTVVMVAFTGIEEFIIVVISVMLLENLVVWIMLGSEDGGVVVGWSDGVVTRSCKVVPVAWVVFEVFVLVVMIPKRLKFASNCDQANRCTQCGCVPPLLLYKVLWAVIMSCSHGHTQVWISENSGRTANPWIRMKVVFVLGCVQLLLILWCYYFMDIYNFFL